MDSKSGLKNPISVIIPTRKLNDITLNNIKLLSNYFKINNILFKIIVISNNDIYNKYPEFTIYTSDIKNAAVSRNIGIVKSNFEEGTFIFLDDDIVVEEKKIEFMFSFIINNKVKEIFAPYITGHFIKEDYKFNRIVNKFYSWAFRVNLKTYADIQGKSFFSLSFPAIFSNAVNMVEWIPGGCMIFNNFKKKEVYFDLSIFGENYFMEDFFLSNQFFLNGVKIKMLPLIFEHKITYNKYHISFKIKYKEIILRESNRIEIQKIRSMITNESFLKYRIILFSYYFYRLKTFKFEDVASLIAILKIILWNNRK